jgi:hypothetical protein
MGAPPALRALLAGLAIATLGAGVAGADDPARKPPPPDPDPGFLEFLGSIDGLAELSPDYAAQAAPARVARVSVKGRAAPAPPPAAGRNGGQEQ